VGTIRALGWEIVMGAGDEWDPPAPATVGLRRRQALRDSCDLWVRLRHQMQCLLKSWILAPGSQTRAEFAHSISRSIRLNASARRVSST